MNAPERPPTRLFRRFCLDGTAAQAYLVKKDHKLPKTIDLMQKSIPFALSLSKGGCRTCSSRPSTGSGRTGLRSQKRLMQEGLLEESMVIHATPLSPRPFQHGKHIGIVVGPDAHSGAAAQRLPAFILHEWRERRGILRGNHPR